MRQIQLLMAATVLLLCGCATQNSPPLPDGESRVQINSRTEIEAFTARLPHPAAPVKSPPLVESRLAALQLEVDRIKLRLSAIEATRAQSLGKKSKGPADSNRYEAGKPGRPAALTQSRQTPGRDRTQNDPWTFNQTAEATSRGAR